MGAEFSTLDDAALVSAALDTGLRLRRTQAVIELAERSLQRPDLLPALMQAIALDKRIGFHHGAPIGWFGADHLFLSNQKRAIATLLAEMDRWDATEQEDLVRHWAGREGLAALTARLARDYGWSPRYKVA